MAHQEIQIGHGVYITDFRKGGTLKGLSPFNNEGKDILLLIYDIRQLDSKTYKLYESIDLIKEEDDWYKDNVYLECILENYQVIVKYGKQMEELARKVLEQGYKPNDYQMEKMLNTARIIERREKHELEMKKFIEVYMAGAAGNAEEKKLVEVNNQNDYGGVYV